MAAGSYKRVLASREATTPAGREAIWKLLTLILNILGRILCALLGIALMMTGVAVALSVIGAPLGIPLAAFGFLLTIRALF